MKKQRSYLNLICLVCLLSVLMAGGCASGESADASADGTASSEGISETAADSVSDNPEEDAEESGDGDTSSDSYVYFSEGEDSSTGEYAYTASIFAMDTYMTVTAYGDSAQAAVEAAADEILRLDALLSTGISTSEVAQVNANGGGTISEETGYLLSRALALYESTDGAFDIAVYPIMDAWGFTTRDYTVPDAETIAELLTLTDASLVSYDADAGTVSFGMDGMQIDLGGIAKGYTSSLIMDLFEENGVESGLVSLGGNVQALNVKPDGSLWRVAVQSPEEDGTFLGILEIEDCAVITSGGYERYFEEDGATYHHIIDPETGYPADNGLVSVTIVSDDGTLADGLSTSLYIMGPDEAIAYWRANSDAFEAVLETDDGTIYVTEGLADSFTSDYDYVIVTADE